MDDKLPHRKTAEVELVDALIRILDYCEGFGYDVQGAMRKWHIMQVVKIILMKLDFLLAERNSDE